MVSGQGSSLCWTGARFCETVTGESPLEKRVDVLQEMMQVMVSERGGKLYSTDERYCIDNGAMIAWPGLLAFKHGQVTPFEETTCTQRFRTDDVLVTWRDGYRDCNG